MTQSAVLAQMGSQNQTFRNRIINGWMAINQRVSSLSTNNSQGYFVDRMWGFSGGSTAATFSQQSSSGLAGFPYFARAQRNSGNTGTAGIFFGQIIESNNLQDLQGQPITVSFWARAGSNYSNGSAMYLYVRTGTAADQGLNATISPGWTGQVDQTSTITITTSWQYFTRTFTLPSNMQELTVFFNNPGVGTAGTNDYFDVTGFQVELGTTATPFEQRLYGAELVLCQRYYQAFQKPSARGVASASTSLNRLALPLEVQMRSAPGVSISGTIDWYDGSNTGTITALSSTYSTINSIEFDASAATGSTVANRPIVIYNGSDTGSIIANAEL